MKRQIFLGITILIVLALLFFYVKVYDRRFFSVSNERITLRFRYMQYACGDCYPQWRADSLITAGNNGKRLIGKDMRIFYHGKELDNLLGEGDSLWNCMICSDFFISGKVEKTLSEKYRLIADQYKYLTDTACCKN